LQIFSAIGFRERTAKNGKILCEKHRPGGIDAAEAGNKGRRRRGAGSWHAEIDATVTNKFVELLEGAFVQQ